MATSVSVIVPFYGTAHSKRLDLVSESILSQRGIDIDFIVVGLKTATQIRDTSDLPKHSKEEAPKIVKTGAVINNGLRLAKGNFIYVTDADVLLLNQNYLEGLVQESFILGTSLKRPPMRRLLVQDFDWFYSMVSSKSLKEAITYLDTSQKYVAKPAGVERHLKIFPKFENRRHKVFIASEADFQEYISNEENKGLEPLYFNQDRHCGAVFAPKEAFVSVGGYAKGFISWGVWDADIQWKLENQTGISLIPYREEFEVIHLDHEKGYFSKSKWENDKKLQEKRRTLGFEACVREDVGAYLGGQNGK